jgi:hypothetical protein
MKPDNSTSGLDILDAFGLGAATAFTGRTT